MNTKYILSSLVALSLLGSCAKESIFIQEENSGMGSFSTENLLLDVRDGGETAMEAPGNSRAGELDDFKILFFKNNSVAPEASYFYSEMPDVVVLPVGKYKVTATKGADVEAEWESPYLVGNSDEFDIKEDEITSDLDPIVCKLENVQVSINFGPMLSGNMSEDSYVEVKVGDNAGLQFSKHHEGMSGHFRHYDASLVATFHGEVEGIPTVETKSIDRVQKGHHYKITFKYLTQTGSHQGEVDASINLDASVTTVDLENNVVIGEDEDLGDDERPKEDLGNQDDPTPPSNLPPTIDVLPQTDPSMPEIDLNKENVIVEGLECVLMIKSSAEGGFTKFDCKVDSEVLDITEVGLSNPLDLINPGNNEEQLVGLGLLEEGETVKGAKTKKFDLSRFLPLITGLGIPEGKTFVDHKFILTIGDANGETTKTLVLRSK